MDGGSLTTSRQVHARQIDVITRCMGDLVGGLMLEADVTDILLNEDGRVWVTRLGRDSHPAGFMAPGDAVALIGATAATLGKVATGQTPVVEGELLTDGSRFLGIVPPNVRAPVFAIRKKASAVIPLIEYERRGLMTGRQRRVIEDAVRDRRNIIICGGTGSGKAQPDEALVLTPTGFRRIADLNVGSPVLAPDGRVCAVTGVFPQGKKTIYRITFEDGRAAECCDDHLWKVWTRTSQYIPGAPRHACGKRSMGWRVVALSDIRRWFGIRRAMFERTAVPLVAPFALERTPQDLPIPPYALGALIGDGDLGNSCIKLSSPDQPVLDRVLADLPDYEAVHIRLGTVDYRFRLRERARISPLRSKLVELGLFGRKSHEKFVPDIYKWGSVEQRLSILQGLLDTDGTTTPGASHVSFSTTSRRLALDVQEIAWSLGAIAKISNRQTYFTGSDGRKKAGRPSFLVSIVHPDSPALFSLPRQVERIRPTTLSHRLRITSIEPVGVKPARCIAVDHPDGLYVTNDYIVTHNTTLLNAILHAVAEQTPEDRVLIGEDTREAQCSSPNHVFIRTSATVTLSDILAAMLRLFPTRIVIGEVRRGEAFDLLMAWNTGHPGGVCTVHSDIVNPRAALSRLELMVSMAMPNVPLQRLIAEAVGLIVCVRRMPDGTRRVTRIVAVEGFGGGDYTLRAEDPADDQD